MTDEHGSDQQPVHEEGADQDHHAQSGDAGVWSDDHPPVDDFSDAGNAGEETATVSQEAAEGGDETAMATTGPSRSMLPLFAGIGGLLLIGAVIYWQFGHSAPPPPMMPVQTSSPKSSSSLGTNSNAQAPISATPKKVEESDITSLYKSPNESGSPAPAETTPTTAMAPTPEATPPVPAMPAAPMPAAQSAPAPVVAATPAANARIDGLAARMDTLQKAVEATSVQLTQLNTMVAANQAMPPVNNQANPALEDRLNKIEQSLMQIEHKEAAKVPTVTMPEESEATPEAASSKPVTHHKHVTAKHKHKTSTKTTTHHTMVMAPMPTLPEQRASSEWVLRAATPTEAWVATDARTAELKHVQIGDTLSGIGQIRSIRQTASGWEIEGSAGTIR